MKIKNNVVHNKLARELGMNIEFEIIYFLNYDLFLEPDQKLVWDMWSILERRLYIESHELNVNLENELY